MEKTTKLKKFDDKEGFNSSFMTTKNIIWFHKVMQWLPDPVKPLVFLPCARANKTRDRFSKKFISQSMSHQFLSAITRNDAYEKVIVSEPLTVIPYSIEADELRPDYNLPVKELSIQSEIIFIHQLSLWLLNIKRRQEERSVIFYIGSRHHYFILKMANDFVGSPFQIIAKIPPRGIMDYAKSANEFNLELQQYLHRGVLPLSDKPILEQHVLKRGRYTNLNFWRFIITLKGAGKKEGEIEVCGRDERKTGFANLFAIEDVVKS